MLSIPKLLLHHKQKNEHFEYATKIPFSRLGILFRETAKISSKFELKSLLNTLQVHKEKTKQA
jgi:hypothetical protein